MATTSSTQLHPGFSLGTAMQPEQNAETTKPDGNAIRPRTPSRATETGVALQMWLKLNILSFQEYCYLVWRAFQNFFAGRSFWGDLMVQADVIGVGSVPITIRAVMTGPSSLTTDFVTSTAVSDRAPN